MSVFFLPLLESLLYCIVGGLLLYASQPPRRLAPLQFIAISCFLQADYTPNLPTPHWVQGALFGLVFGIAYVVPTLLQLRLLPIVSAILGLAQTLEWVILGALWGQFHFSKAPWNCFAISVSAIFVAWIGAIAVPLWGRAQSWARGWSDFPRFVQFSSLTGIFGAHGVIFLLCALVVDLDFHLNPWMGAISINKASLSFIWSLIFTALFVAVNLLLWHRKQISTLKVAVIGWSGEAFNQLEWNLPVFQTLLNEALESGAQLIVTPEAAFYVQNREEWRRKVRALANSASVALAIGYFDNQRNENCIDFISPDGESQGRYLKTHLVPILEVYNAGKGLRSGMKVQGVQVGGMICQDDNFVDVARGYGRDGAQLLAIPTHDWSKVKDFHFASSRWRALENRFAIARAASNGISAITSPRGEVLVSCDHYAEGARVLFAEVPIETPKPTLYARFGDWLPILCGFLVLISIWLCR